MSPMAEKITAVDSDKQESTANVIKALPMKVCIAIPAEILIC